MRRHQTAGAARVLHHHRGRRPLPRRTRADHRRNLGRRAWRDSWLEAETSRTFGRGPHPLLVSVRSGATHSMPGMMDTILDLGMNDAVEQALAARPPTRQFAHDTRRRFDRIYQRIVRTGPDVGTRRPVRAAAAGHRGRLRVVELAPRSCLPRPLGPQQGPTIRAAPRWWCRPWCSATMTPTPVLGSLFSRNPITGANVPFGEWLPGGQGDEVVSGVVDVEPITALRDEQPARLRRADGRRPQVGTARGPTSKRSSSPSRTASCGCCRRERRSGQRRRRCDWRCNCATRGSSTTPRRCAGSPRHTSRLCCCRRCSPKHDWPHHFWPRAWPPARGGIG